MLQLQVDQDQEEDLDLFKSHIWNLNMYPYLLQVDLDVMECFHH